MSRGRVQKAEKDRGWDEEEQRLLGDAIQPALQMGVSQSSGPFTHKELHVALWMTRDTGWQLISRDAIDRHKSRQTQVLTDTKVGRHGS